VKIYGKKFQLGTECIGRTLASSNIKVYTATTHGGEHLFVCECFLV